MQYPPIATFAPDHFAISTAKDSGRFKQFRRAIDQLDGEGVVRVLRSDLRGNQSRSWPRSARCSSRSPCRGMETEFGAAINLETLGHTQARGTDTASAAELGSVRGLEVMARNDGTCSFSPRTNGGIRVVDRDLPTSPSSRCWRRTADPVLRARRKSWRTRRNQGVALPELARVRELAEASPA